LLDAKAERELDPNNIKIKVAQVKAFQRLERIYSALKSYENFTETTEQMQLAPVVAQMHTEKGIVENLKAEIKKELPQDDTTTSIDIEFTAKNVAAYIEKIDSYYINKLLSDLRKSTSKAEQDQLREKITKEIDNKTPVVKQVYAQILADIALRQMHNNWQDYFINAIDSIVASAATKLQVPSDSLHTSLGEYQSGRDAVPYINIIVESSALDKDTFEARFGERYRARSLTIAKYWRDVMETQLLPLKEELT